MNKKIIAPILSISLLGLVSVGTTFALFTSNDEANVAVTAGKVKVSAKLSNLELYSASTEDTDETGIVIPGSHDLGEFSDDYYFVKQDSMFVNGGTASLSSEGGLLTLTNVAPGDKVTFDLDVENSSNIDIKYRVKAFATAVEGLEDKNLFSALDFEIDGFDYSGVESIATPWKAWSTTEENTLSISPISISLPINASNVYQENGTDITFVLEAVQGNASVLNETEDVAFVNKVNKVLAREELEFPTQALIQLSDEDLAGLFEIENLVWNAKFNLFGVNDAGLIDYGNCDISPLFDDSVWVFADEYVNAGQPVYLLGDSATGTLNISTSFDAGENENIELINYVNFGEAKTVVIRTCSDSTVLSIDAPNDTVKHYDRANHVVVNSVAMSSYHEFGHVLGNITLVEGNVVVEEGCSASAVVIDMTAEELATVTTVAADNSQEPEVPIILNTTNYAWSVNENNSLINPQTNNIIYTKAPVEGKEASTDPADMVDYGALVGETGYLTFPEALSACGSGQTVRLLKDYKYETSPSYVYTQKARYGIDLNGHTLDLNNTGYGIYVLAGQTLTISDSEGSGKILNKQQIAYMKDGATLVINGGYLGGVTADQATIYGYGNIIVNGGTIDGAKKNNYNYYAVMIGNYSNDGTPASFIMTNGTINGSLYVSGNDKDNNIINISGGAINASNYIAGNTTTTITGGTFTGTTCFYFKGSTINISGGSFTSIKGDGDWKHQDSSCTNTGDAVIIEACNYPAGNPVINITGGTFKGFKEEGGTEPTSGNIYFKNFGILVINYSGNTTDVSGTTVSYAEATVSSNTDENFVTENGYLHFTENNVTIVQP